MKKYEVLSVRVEEYKTGPNAGMRKPISLPDEAIPLGVVSGMNLHVYFLLPVTS